MVETCCAVDCHNKRVAGSGITYHKFPLKNEELLAKWVQAVKRLNWKPTKWSVLCSEHFSKDDFYPDQCKKILRENVIPTIFSHRPAVKKRPPPKNRQPLEYQQNVSTSRRVLTDLSLNCQNVTPARVNFDFGVCIYSPREVQNEKENENVMHTNAIPISPVVVGRKRKTYEEIKRDNRLLREKLKRRDNKIESLQDLQKNLLEYGLSNTGWKFIEANFSSEIVMLLENEFKNARVDKRGHRYCDNLLAFANTLHYYSPKAYGYITSIFTLPSTITLWRIADNIECEPGFLSEVFTRLKADLSIKPWLKDCVLVVDGMSIRKSKRFDVKRQKMAGYVEYGSSNDVECGNTLATELLMVMLVCTTASFKVPIAYFLTNKTSGYVLYQIIKNAIEKLYSIGIRIWALTFDGASSNVSCAKQFGCVIEKEEAIFRSTFPHPTNPSENISIFFDPCHMIKLARNALASWGVIESEDGLIRWQYLVDLEQLQKEMGLRFANKLTGTHINYHNAKMKVYLAVQLFSSSVADALEFLEKSGHPKFMGASATIKFLRMLDRLFDLLNSSNHSAKGYKQPLELKNAEHWCDVLRNSKQYLLSLKHNRTPITQTQKCMFVIGLVYCIQSAQTYAMSLLTKTDHPLQYVRMYTISQDHLELFFGLLRRRGGQNNNPDVLQVKSTMKRILLKNNLTASAFGNVIALDSSFGITVIDFRQKKKNKENNEAADDHANEEELDENYGSEKNEKEDEEEEEKLYYNKLQELNMYQENIIFYIAGYIVRHLLPRLVCPLCRESLMQQMEQRTTDHSYHSTLSRCTLTPSDFLKFINRGGLIFPSKPVFEIIKLCEKYFRLFENLNRLQHVRLADLVFREIVETGRVNFFAETEQHTSSLHAAEALHSTQLIKLICERFISMRLKAYGKSSTKEIHGNKATVRSFLTQLVLNKNV